MEALQATLELACCENDKDEPPALTLTTASSRPPCGRNPVTVATPATASAGPDALNMNTSCKATIALTDSNVPMHSQDLDGSYTQLIKKVLVASAEQEAPSSMHKGPTALVSINVPTCSYNLESLSFGLPRSSSDEMPQVLRIEQPPISSHKITTTSLQCNYLVTSQSTQHWMLALPVQNTDCLVPSSTQYAQAVSVNQVTMAALTTASSMPPNS